jgi:hypothetical protein
LCPKQVGGNPHQLSETEVRIVPITWETDVEAGLAKAKQQNRAVLLDFSAAPM